MSGTYRKNVGVVLFNKDGQVLMFDRAEMPGEDWQFPQGGIDENETPLEAAYRELREETGITQVELVVQMPTPLRYEFPDFILERFKNLGRENIGQEQYWTLFYFKGNESDIKFDTHPEEIEFKGYKWVNPEDAPKVIIDFKKEVYQKMICYFEPFISSWKEDGAKR